MVKICFFLNSIKVWICLQIRSDEETSTSIIYSLTGSGADQPPINLFTVTRKTGLVKIHGVLDREKTPIYYVSSSFIFYTCIAWVSVIP